MTPAFTNFYRLFRAAYGRFRPQLILLVVLGFLSGLLEGLGINALIPLFSFAPGQDQAATDFITRQLTNLFAFFDLHLSLTALAVFVASAFFLKAVVKVILDYLKFRITADYEWETRQGLFAKILAADFRHLLKQKLGVLETILMIDVPVSSSLLNQLSGGIMYVTGLLVYVFVALNISARITIYTLALGLIFFFIFQPILVRIKNYAQQRNRINKEMAHHISENILGMKRVKTMLVEPSVEKKAREYFSALREFAQKVPFLKSLPATALEPVAVIFVIAVYLVNYQAPGFNLIALGAIIYLVNKILNYVQQLQRVGQAITDFSPHLRSILEFEQDARREREIRLAGEPFAFSDKLVFQNVSFAYAPGRPVLSGLTFEIRKGEMVGLVGPSGVGKTTLVDLLLRLFAPDGGEILLDGRSAREIDLDDWRRHIGYVSQDVFLMNDTIANNIRFYSPAITQDEIENAAQMANIHEFIESLPQKYETLIGERGVRLSGGERQRVVLARIFARRPEILILDEATSALDNESEREIQEVIRKLKGRMTVIAIAHRLTTVMDSDKLFILEDGKLVEQGEPQALLQDKNSYFFRTLHIAGT